MRLNLPISIELTTSSLRAWIFAAGLLLGFWLFAQCDKSEAEVVEAFQQSRNALQRIAAFSPQASHYYEILTALHNAIERHRSKRADERKRFTSQYVDQVLTFGQDSSLPTTDNALDPTLFDVNDTPQLDFDGDGDDDNALDQDNRPLPSDTLDQYDLSISEDFPWPGDDLEIDWEPFAPFLDELG